MNEKLGSEFGGNQHDGLNFVQELTGTTPKANLLTGGIDEVFERKESAATRYPISDALGSVIALTDATGALSTQYSFNPYGTASKTGAGDTNSQTYTGREDDGTGLFYYRARYYAPALGRFITEDPIGTSGGPNLYAYVSNSPTNYRDPSGNGPAIVPILVGGWTAYQFMDWAFSGAEAWNHSDDVNNILDAKGKADLACAHGVPDACGYAQKMEQQYLQCIGRTTAAAGNFMSNDPRNPDPVKGIGDLFKK